MITIVRKLYDTKEEQVEALKKYMVFFNTEPSWIGTVIHGITISMEEQKANGADITAEDINALRTGLMGPMAGIGDTVSQSVAYPILAGICCSFALDGNYLGPFLFEVMYKFLMIFCGYNCFMLGYKQGRSAIVSLLQSGTLNRITEAFSIIGLAVVGNMAYSRVTVSCPLAFTVGQVDVVVQDMFDTLLPGIIPLLITLAVWWMIFKEEDESDSSHCSNLCIWYRMLSAWHSGTDCINKKINIALSRRQTSLRDILQRERGFLWK